MTHLTIKMTEAELFALDMIALDKQEWADNVLTNRARVAMEDMKTTSEWALALAKHIQAGGDPLDDWNILLTGRDAGLFKTAVEIEAALQEKLSSPQIED